MGWHLLRLRWGTLAVALVLAASVVAGSLLVARTRALIAADLSANWRGSYDLLVTAGESHVDVGVKTEGLVEPNFVAYARGGIEFAQVEAIAALAEVEVAAPLMFVGEVATPLVGVEVAVDEPMGGAECSDVPRLTGLTVRATVDEGPVTRDFIRSGRILVIGCQDGVRPFLGSVGRDTRGGASFGVQDGKAHFEFDFEVVPEARTGLVAVDPLAEGALLGDRVGLGRLAEFDRARREGASAGGLAALVPDTWWPVQGEVAGAADTKTVLPVVVNSAGFAPLSATVSALEIETTIAPDEVVVDEVGGARLVPQAEARVLAAGRRVVASETVDLTAALSPFGTASPVLPWPGRPRTNAGSYQSEVAFSPTLALPPGLTPVESSSSGVAAWRIEPQEKIPLAQESRFHTDRYHPNAQAYRTVGPVKHRFPVDVLLAPVSTYAPLVSESGPGYVPLGTYAATPTMVVAGDHAGRPLNASLTGRGVVLPAPGAITSVESVLAASPGATVDVVRVRVAGADVYGEEARRRLAEAAAAISELGLEVRVMAGSSLSPVELDVPSYFVTDGEFPEQSAVSDLGRVRQEWTSLGEAVRVEHASSRGSFTLLLVTLVGVGALAVATLVMGGHQRRSQSQLLSTLGWRRTAIARWFMAEDAPAIGLVLAAGALAVGLARDTVLGGSLAGVALVFVAALCGDAVYRSRADRAPRQAPRQVPAVTTPALVGTRAGAQLTPVTRILAGAWLALSLLAGAVAVALLEQQAALGHSRWSTAALAHLGVPQAILITTGTMAALTLLALGVSQFVNALAPELALLRILGWTRRSRLAMLHGSWRRALWPALAVGLATSTAWLAFPATTPWVAALAALGGLTVGALALTAAVITHPALRKELQ